MPSTSIPVSGVVLIPAHHGCVLPAFVCLPNSSSTSNILWHFIQVIFFDPEAQRDCLLLQTLIKHLWGLCCTLHVGRWQKMSQGLFESTSFNLWNKPRNKLYYFLSFFFFSTVVTTSTRLKNLLKTPGLFRQGSGMMFMSSELQSHLTCSRSCCFLPFSHLSLQCFPWYRLGWLTSCLVSRFQTWEGPWALCDPFWMLVTFHKTVTQTCLLDQYRMTGIPWWSIA